MGWSTLLTTGLKLVRFNAGTTFDTSKWYRRTLPIKLYGIRQVHNPVNNGACNQYLIF